MTRVGFIGLGNQGAPIARRIVEHGHELVLWARRPESTEPFADTGAEVLPSAADVGAASEVVGVCVFTDADVQDVLRSAPAIKIVEPGPGLDAMKLPPDSFKVKPPADPA